VIVADASVVVEVLLQTPAAVAIEASLFDAANSLHAPALLDIEIVQVLRRYVRVGDLSPARAATVVDLLIRFPITRYAHEPLLERIWMLRDAMTAYDAAYVALAQGLDATLLTRDAKLARSARRHAKVELM
jgi:predicted nucleic acid-binding protein